MGDGLKRLLAARHGSESGYQVSKRVAQSGFSFATQRSMDVDDGRGVRGVSRMRMKRCGKMNM